MDKAQREHLIQAIAAHTRLNQIILLGGDAAAFALESSLPELAGKQVMQVMLADSNQKSIDYVFDSDSEFFGRHGYGAEAVYEDMFPMPDEWRDRATTIDVDAAGGKFQVIVPAIPDLCAMAISDAVTNGKEDEIGWVGALLAAKALNVRDLWNATNQVEDGDTLWPTVERLAQENGLEYDPDAWSEEEPEDFEP